MEAIDHPSMEPILNIVGEKVALGPHRRDLLPLYTRWINDFEVTRNLSMGLRPTTAEAEERWYDGIVKRDRDVLFTIYDLSTRRPIGSSGLHNIDHQNRTAEFGILIGERECWGKGYGTEATRLMLDYGFTLLGLHNIMLYVMSYNERAVRAYTRAGFRLLGRRRESQRVGDKAYDVLLMDCLSTEFQSPLLHRLQPRP